jgi:hypothetical protein
MIGAVLLGIQFLAGHAEISVYNLVVTAFYAAVRFFSLTPIRLLLKNWIKLAFIAVMTGIGVTLGAIHLVPLYEVLRDNFRVGSVNYETVISYAYPIKQIATFFMPDFFGNPTHHAYIDLFDFSFHPAPTGTIFWGTKNYVEAGAYVGILPLLLIAIAIISTIRAQVTGHRAHITLFTSLALISLLFTFGTPLYAILFFGVPGFNQLHTPFRWIFPYTLSIAVLAGIGAEELVNAKQQAAGAKPSPAARRAFYALPIMLGALILAILAST